MHAPVHCRQASPVLQRFCPVFFFFSILTTLVKHWQKLASTTTAWGGSDLDQLSLALVDHHLASTCSSQPAVYQISTAMREARLNTHVQKIDPESLYMSLFNLKLCTHIWSTNINLDPHYIGLFGPSWFELSLYGWIAGRWLDLGHVFFSHGQKTWLLKSRLAACATWDDI